MKLFGHPLHPLLVHFPVALWTLAAMAQGAVMAGASREFGINWPDAAHWLNVGGLATAPLAMAAGMMDMTVLRDDAPVMAVAELHMLLMAGAYTGYLAAALAPAFAGGHSVLIATACMSCGFIMLGLGGYFGGQLVYRHGAGVMRPRS